MVQRNMNKSELKEKIRRMKMEIQELEECLDKYEERIIVMTMTLSIEVVILMTTKNVITKEKNMGIVSVVVMDVINMKSSP